MKNHHKTILVCLLFSYYATLCYTSKPIRNVLLKITVVRKRQSAPINGFKSLWNKEEASIHNPEETFIKDMFIHSIALSPPCGFKEMGSVSFCRDVDSLRPGHVLFWIYQKSCYTCIHLKTIVFFKILSRQETSFLPVLPCECAFLNLFSR